MKEFRISISVSIKNLSGLGEEEGRQRQRAVRDWKGGLERVEVQARMGVDGSVKPLVPCLAGCLPACLLAFCRAFCLALFLSFACECYHV